VHRVTDEPPTTPAAPSSDAAGADRDLLDRLRARDEQAFNDIVRRWSPVMLRVARGYVSTDASAQEVVQETWLGVIRGLAAFEGRSALRTWVFRILVNVAKTRGVKEHRSTPFSSMSPGEDNGPTVDPNRFRDPDADDWPRHWTPAGAPRPWHVDPETAALRAETRSLVSAAVDQLPERQRAVVVLRDVQGFDSDEVCDLLGVSAQNQRVLLHRGRAKIRAQLEAYYERADR